METREGLQPHSVDDLKHGARGRGNKGPAGDDFFPVDLLGKVDEVANLVESSLIEKIIERPPLIPGSTESSSNRDVGVSVSAFPYLK